MSDSTKQDSRAAVTSAAGEAAEAPQPLARRSLLFSGAMLLALAASYGTFAAMALRFLYPARRRMNSWLFVSEASRLGDGESLRFVTPQGAPMVVARQGTAGTADDFIALSSTCPHLGCQVHWDAAKKHFVCPCHNGIFDAQGKATEGPPFKSGQSLPRYGLKVDAGLLYVAVPVDAVAKSGNGPKGAHGPTASACSGCPRASHKEA